MARKDVKRAGQRGRITESKPKIRTALKNKLVITSKKPSKPNKQLCLQLRKVFEPDCMANLKETSQRFRDCLEVADAFRISHLLFISADRIVIGQRPRGPTYSFKILEYKGGLESCPSEFYSKPAFVTFDGTSELKCLFERFGRTVEGFRRVLHFCFIDDIVYIRHYRTVMKDTDDNFVVGLKEIGPRLTLKYLGMENGFFKTGKYD